MFVGTDNADLSGSYTRFTTDKEVLPGSNAAGIEMKFVSRYVLSVKIDDICQPIHRTVTNRRVQRDIHIVSDISGYDRREFRVTHWISHFYVRKSLRIVYLFEPRKVDIRFGAVSRDTPLTTFETGSECVPPSTEFPTVEIIRIPTSIRKPRLPGIRTDRVNGRIEYPVGRGGRFIGKYPPVDRNWLAILELCPVDGWRPP